MTHGESWESQHSNVFVTKYSSGQWILHLFLHIQTRNCIDSTAEPAYCSPNQSHNLGERDGNRSKLHHPRPPAPPRCWLTCATPTHGWWPILAAREHRDRCRGHHDSAALATNFSCDDKGGGGWVCWMGGADDGPRPPPSTRGMKRQQSTSNGSIKVKGGRWLARELWRSTTA